MIIEYKNTVWTRCFLQKESREIKTIRVSICKYSVSFARVLDNVCERDGTMRHIKKNGSDQIKSFHFIVITYVLASN